MQINKRKLELTLAISTIVLVNMALFVMVMNKPKDSTISSEAGALPTIESKFFQYSKYENDLLTFDYPEGWTVNLGKQSTGTGSIIEINSKDSDGKGPFQLSLTPVTDEAIQEKTFTYDFNGDLQTIKVDDKKKAKDSVKNLKLRYMPNRYYFNNYFPVLLIQSEDLETTGSAGILVGEFDKNFFIGQSSSYTYSSELFPFLGLTAETKVKVTLNCKDDSNDNFQKCAEFVERFFATVTKK